jgi:transposase InsO family protein
MYRKDTWVNAKAMRSQGMSYNEIANAWESTRGPPSSSASEMRSRRRPPGSGPPSSTNVEVFPGELLDYLPFPVMGIQTDDGSEYMKHFDEALEKLGITHYFSHPNCPQENTRVERNIQTSKQELWAHRAGYDVGELNRITSEWNETYNDYRPHQSPGYLTPNEFLKSWYDLSKRREHVSTM